MYKSILLLFVLIFYFKIALSQHTPNILTKEKIVCHDYIVYSDSFNKSLEMWYNVRLIIKNDTFKIKNLHNDNGSEFDIVCSPNCKYFLIDNITKGYIENEGKTELYENYHCVIVNIAKHKVVYEMQWERNGGWNKFNQWISHGKVVFDPNRVR